jgi:hypothetical protein
MNSEHIGLGELIAVNTRVPPALVEGREVLVAIDETNVSLNHISVDELPDDAHLLGAVNNTKLAGFSLYAGLAIDEQGGSLLGLSDIVHHCVPPTSLKGAALRKERSARKKLPFEHRESYCWSLIASNTHLQLSHARRVTYVMDRGGDSYETLATILSMERAEVLVRLRVNRQGRNPESGLQGRMADLLAATVWQQSKTVFIPKLDHISKKNRKRKRRKPRKASLKIRHIPFEPDFPTNYAGDGRAITRPLTLIEVKEDSASVPADEEPIHWRLLTSRVLNSTEQAWHIVECYKRRWYIEQLFRLFKKQGFDIEATQFKNHEAILRLAIMSLRAASASLTLDMASKAQEPIPIQTFFEQEQQALLKALLPRLEGKTTKLQNPYQPNDLRWAAWIIARLGRWSGYASQRAPGPITFLRGLEKFQTILWAINAMDEP